MPEKVAILRAWLKTRKLRRNPWTACLMLRRPDGDTTVSVEDGVAKARFNRWLSGICPAVMRSGREEPCGGPAMRGP